jgi:proline iminopeptidase
MIGEGEHYIDVDGIKTFVTIVGQGPPILIVHGGPGFSHEYLVDPLDFLTKDRTLIFYDQPGCGKTDLGDRTLSPLLTYQHLLSFTQLIVNDARIDLLAHSWGALVILEQIRLNVGHSLLP